MTDPITIPANPNNIAKIRKFFRFGMMVLYLFLIYLLELSKVFITDKHPKTASSILTVCVP